MTEDLAGTQVTLEDVPKTQIEIVHKNGSFEFSKEFRYKCGGNILNLTDMKCQNYFYFLFNFRQELVSKFTFSNGTTAERTRKNKESIQMPASIPPMFELQVVNKN